MADMKHGSSGELVELYEMSSKRRHEKHMKKINRDGNNQRTTLSPTKVEESVSSISDAEDVEVQYREGVSGSKSTLVKHMTKDAGVNKDQAASWKRKKKTWAKEVGHSNEAFVDNSLPNFRKQEHEQISYANHTVTDSLSLGENDGSDDTSLSLKNSASTKLKVPGLNLHFLENSSDEPLEGNRQNGNRSSSPSENAEKTGQSRRAMSADSSSVNRHRSSPRKLTDKKKKVRRKDNSFKSKCKDTDMKELCPVNKSDDSCEEGTAKHASSEETEPNKPNQDLTASSLNYEKIIGIVIHRADPLEDDILVQHPVVKVHIVDVQTGHYLKKSCPSRPVSFFYEKDVQHIQPLMTAPCNFKKRRSLVPVWEELLVFNDDVNCILGDNPPVIIIFEIMDFVNYSIASSNYKRLGSDGGWHKVAWAFLKPVGANRVLNTERRIRLQLYRPAKTKTSSFPCEAFVWWKEGEWRRYPGCLHMTVKGMTPPSQLPPALRSRSALQHEYSSSQAPGEAVTPGTEQPQQILPDTPSQTSRRSQMVSQSCKLPNRSMLQLPTSSLGYFSLKFSNSGSLLACGAASESTYPVVIYTIPEGKQHVRLTGHQGLVYELNWSVEDVLLLSASADCTVCVWDMTTTEAPLLAMLPHPSFVYCAQFRPRASLVLASGSNDTVVRVWRRPKSARKDEFQLIQELQGHSGFVTTLCFDKSGNMISGDSLGTIIFWNKVKKTAKVSGIQFTSVRKLKLTELRNVIINKLVLHPGGHRLLIHARDSLLRMLDVATGTVLQWYKGAVSDRYQTAACMSPCGSLVLSTSEDGTISAWSVDTGAHIGIYTGLQYTRGTFGIDYHPYENVVAVSSFGDPSRVIVCDYTKNIDVKSIGLAVFKSSDVSDVGTSRTLNSLVTSGKSVFTSDTCSDTSLSSSMRKYRRKLQMGRTLEEKLQPHLNYHAGGGNKFSGLSEDNLFGTSGTYSAHTRHNNSKHDPTDSRLVRIIEEMDHILLGTSANTVELGASAQNLETGNNSTQGSHSMRVKHPATYFTKHKDSHSNIKHKMDHTADHSLSEVVSDSSIGSEIKERNVVNSTAVKHMSEPTDSQSVRSEPSVITIPKAPDRHISKPFKKPVSQKMSNSSSSDVGGIFLSPAMTKSEELSAVSKSDSSAKDHKLDIVTNTESNIASSSQVISHLEPLSSNQSASESELYPISTKLEQNHQRYLKGSEHISTYQKTETALLPSILQDKDSRSATDAQVRRLRFGTVLTVRKQRTGAPRD